MSSAPIRSLTSVGGGLNRGSAKGASDQRAAVFTAANEGGRVSRAQEMTLPLAFEALVEQLVTWTIDGSPADQAHCQDELGGQPTVSIELQGLTGPAEVDELDVVTCLGCAVAFREPEVALAAHKSGAAFDHAVDK